MVNRCAIILALMLFLATGSGYAQEEQETGPNEPAYRIDEPGTITFTVGVKIKGKVEKPQVVIFLPKERPQYRDISLEHSFREEITKPLPFTPIGD
jgi:hypothetical protein